MAFIDKDQHQAEENAPVIFNGLEFYPLLVRDYPLYLRAKQSFELMLSSLTPRLARLPWCACLWELDRECEKQTGKTGEYLVGVLCVMAKALRLNAYADGSIPLRPVFSQTGELTAIMLGTTQANYSMLDMRQMDEVRRLIAAENDYEIPDENWNPELVRAAQMNAQSGEMGLEYDLEALVYSVAANIGCRARDIYDWTIREFHGMQHAIDRRLGYVIYTLAETSGYVKYSKGNPFPTWKFDRKSDLPTGFKSIAELDAGAKGLVAGT